MISDNSNSILSGRPESEHKLDTIVQILSGDQEIVPFQRPRRNSFSKWDAECDSRLLYQKHIQPLKSALDALKEEARKLETGNIGCELVKSQLAQRKASIKEIKTALKSMRQEGASAIEITRPWLNSIEREIKVLESRLMSVELAQHSATLVDRNVFRDFKKLELVVCNVQRRSYQKRTGINSGGLPPTFMDIEELQARISTFKKKGNAWLRAIEHRREEKQRNKVGVTELSPMGNSTILLGVSTFGYTELRQSLDGLSTRLADAAAALDEKSLSISLLSAYLSNPPDGAIVSGSKHNVWLREANRLNPSDQALLLSKVARQIFDPDAMRKMGDEASRHLDQGWSAPMIWGLLNVAIKQYLGSFGVATVLVKNTGYPEFLLLAAFMHKVMECALVDDRTGSFNLAEGRNPCVKWSKKMLTDSVPMILFLAAFCLSDLWVQSRAPDQLTGWTKAEGARDLTIRLACGMLGSTASLFAINGLRHGLGGSFRYVHPSLRGADYTQIFRIFCNGPRFFGALSRMLSMVPVVLFLRMGLMKDGPYWPDFVLIGGWMFRDLASDLLDACNCFKTA